MADDPMTLTRFVAATAAFAPVHQGLLDVFKTFGLRARQYWEAIAYVVYGEAWARTANTYTWLGDVPKTVRSVRDAWKAGPEVRFIESLLLRSVGDSPATEISDADVASAARIARRSAGRAGEIGEVLEELIRATPRTQNELIVVLMELQRGVPGNPPDELDLLLGKWINEAMQFDGVSPALLFLWRQDFNRRYLPGVVRAETDLPNALKSAEYRYHWYLRIASAVLAVLEAAALVYVLKPDRDRCEFAFVVAAGILMVVPQSTKGLTDALIGFGRRLKP